ncbi:DUF6169 family protein [Dyadobacter pollutisoli]|uniref:DUF6169 family protein n=1 Tax=Dyadobacter pollutisoli TaxID=2910158 RepID=UPI0035B693FB
MQGESNSLNPYDLVSAGEDSYKFYTDSGIEYIAYFTNSPDYFSKYPDFNNDIVSFTFEPHGKVREALYYSGNRASKILGQSHDKRIMDTVLSLLLGSLVKSPSKSIIMICENDDARDVCRNRLFTRWYNKIFQSNNNLATKNDNELCGEGYCSIFISNSNPYHDTIKKAFDNILFEDPSK